MLTYIKAAATSLLQELKFNKRQRGDLLEMIDEECNRINPVIGQAVEMTQLDAGEAKLQPAPHFVSELISAALKDCAGVENSRTIRTEAEHFQRSAAERFKALDQPFQQKCDGGHDPP